VPLKISTIDSLIRSGQIAPDIKVIKIDTDGYDLFALMGASELLARERPIIFGEFMAACLDWHGQTIADVAAFARRLDYNLYARVRQTWRFTSRFDMKAFVQDALLVPSDSRCDLSWCLAN
jgi:hypothetical protein